MPKIRVKKLDKFTGRIHVDSSESPDFIGYVGLEGETDEQRKRDQKARKEKINNTFRGLKTVDLGE